MMKAYKVTLDVKKLDDAAKEYKLAIVDFIISKAFDVQFLAAENAPYITGALKSSIATRTIYQDNERMQQAIAKKLNPDAEIQDLPEPHPPTLAVVGATVHYGIYVELGHFLGKSGKPGSPEKRRFVAAHPFLMPAFEQEMRKLTLASEWKDSLPNDYS